MTADHAELLIEFNNFELPYCENSIQMSALDHFFYMHCTYCF